MAEGIVEGNWVEVKPEADIPPMFRNNEPTTGRVERIEDGTAEIWVPIGDADVDEHSQAVWYEVDELTLARGSDDAT